MRPVALLLLASSAFAGVPALEGGFRQMYNLQFEDAHRTFERFEREHPEDPLGPAADAAAFLFAEFDRLHILQSEFFLDGRNFKSGPALKPDPAAGRGFYGDLDKAGRLADAALARSPPDTNALFAKVLSCGLRADYLALIGKRSLAALAVVKQGHRLAERLLALDRSYYDAYLAIGVENYLLSLKPAPVRWILQAYGAATDKEKGVAELKLCERHGRYLAPYARLLLAVAAMRDNNRARASELLRDLAREFPMNRLYARELARWR